MQESRKREIRIKADSFRGKCKVSRYGIIDLFKECERWGYKLLRYPLGENADLGFTVKRDNDIIIFTNSCSRLSREIFAAGLLMPSDDAHRFIDLEMQNFEEKGLSAMDIARIMSEFNVSFDMALNRLESLGIIDANQKLCLDNERIEKRVGNLLRSVGGNARLNTPSNEIDIPHEYIDYVIYNYNHNAVPRETLEKVLACYQLTIEDVGDKLVEHVDDDDDDLEDLIGGLDD